MARVLILVATAESPPFVLSLLIIFNSFYKGLTFSGNTMLKELFNSDSPQLLRWSLFTFSPEILK